MVIYAVTFRYLERFHDQCRKKKKYILANKTNQRLTKIKLLFPEGPNTSYLPLKWLD